MTQEDHTPSRDDPQQAQDTSRQKKAWTRWQIALCILAGVLVLGGGIGMLSGDTTGNALEKRLGPAGTSLTGSDTDVPAGLESAWSPAVAGLGFSFFAGLAMGYAIRTFLKLTLIVAGVVLLALYGLDALDLVTIHWDRMDDKFQILTNGISKQFESLKTAITGSLPKAGLGLMGLYTGLRRGGR